MDVPDHFARLGLPRRFAVDLRALERNYLTRSRALHPDFHQLGSTSEQDASLELTSRLNDAYATLRDPFKRAEYLLLLEGGPAAAEQKSMPLQFLEEVLELRMEIEEIRQAPGGGAVPRAAMKQQLLQREQKLFADVDGNFARLEQDKNRAEVLLALRQNLNALKYVRNLLRDLES